MAEAKIDRALGKLSEKRKFVRYLARSQAAYSFIALAAIAYLSLHHLPLDLFRQTPATGGDMGSHYWPLHVLWNYGLEHGSLRTWSPGNLAGEPLLLHYFPLPFVIMAGLAFFVPLGQAFNIGTLLPVILLPFTAYGASRILGWKFPIPILAAALCTVFLYNESFSMWGGNALSTLAGQFAHVYALNFTLLAIAISHWELRRGRLPILSSVLFSAVILSHGYLMLGIPAFLLSVIIQSESISVAKRIRFVLQTGLFTLLLSLWWLAPMAENNTWTTPLIIEWISPTLAAEIFPTNFYPVAALILLASIFLFLRPLHSRAKIVRRLAFWGIPMLYYVGLYFLLPALGLVDVRAVPQVQFFACLLAAELLGESLLAWNRSVTTVVALPIVLAWLGWTETWIANYPLWTEWNYSGWTTKKLYPELQALSEDLRGDLSDPRIVYEHSEANSGAGTIRVFEMLPYFSGRPTLESTYLQASILAPMVYYLQAQVSKQPSCPFRQYPCPAADLAKARQSMRLLGVDTLILSSEDLIAGAEKQEWLHPTKVFGPWHVFQTNEKPNLAEVFPAAARLLAENDWKKAFFSWFETGSNEKELLIPESFLSSELRQNLLLQIFPRAAPNNCKPKVQIELNQLTLTTTCPGTPHFVRVGFHPSWRSNSGEELFPVSPGFLALIPEEERTIIEFGKNKTWDITRWVSIISGCVLFAIMVFQRISRTRKHC